MAKQQHMFIGVDVGSDTLKLVAGSASPEEGGLEVTELVERKSVGVRRGVVTDYEKLAHELSEAGEELERKLAGEIRSVYATIGGSHMFAQPSKGLVSVSRADQSISREDVDRVLEETRNCSLPPNREIVEVIPRDFVVDGEKGIKEPVGLKGVRLEAEVLLVGAFTPYKNNMEAALEEAGFDLERLIASPFASSKAVLSDREKEMGAVVLDIGAGTTSMAVFREGDLVDAVVFPVGGLHITNDIAAFLECDVELAERVKVEMGSCILQGGDKKERIEVEDEVFSFSRKKLSHVIAKRMDQILSAVKKRLDEAAPEGEKNPFPGGVVLTGGTANLRKIREYSRKQLHTYCRIGTPRMESAFEMDPRLSACCGLLLCAKKDAEEGSAVRVSPSRVKEKIKKIFRMFIP